MEEKTVGMELRELTNRIRRTLDRQGALSESGITHMQAWIIGYLYERENEEVYQRDFERIFEIRRPTVCRILQGMERAGLIERRAVAGDGRLRKLLLTDKARALNERLMLRMRDFERYLERGISERERKSFYAVVEKIKKNMDDFGQEEKQC